jgi:predicted DNA-binding transcriptional regulator YafY
VRGIEQTAVQALVKLEQVLPPHLRRRVQALGSATSTLPAPGPTVDPQHLTIIAAACRDTERLRFGYQSRDGTETRRQVEPHAVVNQGRRWYLLAWDTDRGDWRTFRIDRLTRPTPAGKRFARRTLPTKDPAEYVARSISRAPAQYEARVTLHASAEDIERRAPLYWATVEAIDANTCEYTTRDDNLRWLALRIAMLDVEFEVHEPPELIAELRALAARVRRGTR